MAGSSSVDDVAARELNDLRLVFADISGYKRCVGLRKILQLPEVKAQIAEGDVSVEDLESAWLEACAVQGVTIVDPEEVGAKDEQRGSWGVCSALSFEGFLHFLRLCEAKVSAPKGMQSTLETSPRSIKTGRDLVAARHRMVGLLRATLTLHQRGGPGEEDEENHLKDETAQLGEMLHSAMVRAAIEEGLAHHTPETLRELMRTGVYKGTDEEARLEREKKKASLGMKLSKQVPHDELVRSGILREIYPEDLALEKATTAEHVQHRLEHRPSARELVDKGVVPELTSQEKHVERAFLAGKLKHDLEHREGFEELLQKGIALDMAPGEAHEQHLRAAAQVSKRLQSRPSVEYLRTWHIVQSPAEEAKKQAELDAVKSMLQDMYGQDPLQAESGKVDSQEHDHHHRRPSLGELKAQGIYRTPEQVEEEARQHKEAGALLQQELGHRADVSDLKGRGIYLSRGDEMKQHLERSMRSDQLNRAFRDRPYIEDLMDRGVLEATRLQKALQELREKGLVETLDDVMKWPIISAAVKEGVVSMETLRKAFEESKTSGSGQGLSYEEFDAFLTMAETTQVAEERVSLKLWALLRMRPEIDEEEHHESNRSTVSQRLAQSLAQMLYNRAKSTLVVPTAHRRNALMALELEQELEKREPLEYLANKGIFVEKTPTEGAVERAHLTHMLAHGLAHRPDLEELAHKGVYLEGVDAGGLEEAHRDARNTLEGTLSLRPPLSALEEKGYLEADELEEAFAELILEHKHHPTSTTDTTTSRRLLLPADSLASWPPVRKMLESGAAVDEDVAAAFAKAKKASSYGREAGDRDGKGASDDGVDFVGFLEFIHCLDIEVDGLGATGQGLESEDPTARDTHARRLRMRRQRAAQAAQEDSHGTLKEHLVAHLRARPGKRDPETQRIAKEFHSAQAVELEKSLLRDRLEGCLRSRSESTEVSTERGPVRDGERAAKIKELEFAMNKRMLMHHLAKRPPGEVLLNKGILHTQSAAQEKLQRLVASDRVKHFLSTRPSLREMKEAGVYRGDGSAFAAEHEALASKLAKGLEKRRSREDVTSSGINPFLSSSPAEEGMDLDSRREAIEGRLERRASLDELTNQGIFQNTTPLQHSLDRHLVEQRLSQSLRNPRRPSKTDLVAHGIYLDATPRELQMEHYLATRNLKHALEKRGSVQDLKDHGIYKPEDSQRAAHEKLLVKAFLQRKLSHAFSSEELARLKQKGIYKKAEHEKLEAERLLVTRQLARLVSKRPDPEQLAREHPGLMEASTLALVFEERVMPRVRGGEGRDGEEAEAETEGGPEHLVSFEGLMTWPDVQEHLAGEGGKEEAKHQMALHFELCDADGDGFITFSQFLRWVELCGLNPEDHLQVVDADLDAEYARLSGPGGKFVTLDQAASSPLVQRWATSAALDQEALAAMWGNEAARSVKQADGFKAFCRHCESRSSAVHQLRLAGLQAKASAQEAEAKAALRSKLSTKLSNRPDLEELKKARIYRAGGLDPATEHLERNLIAISLKERLLARPVLADLEKRGIKPKQGTKAQRAKNSLKLSEALDATMQHDDAQWRSHPSQLGAGPRTEVSAFLQESLSKRLPIQELTNKGIYVIDTDASYAFLIHRVLQTHRDFTKSSAELVLGL